MKKILAASIDRIIEFDTSEEAAAYIEKLRLQKQEFHISSREEVDGKVRIRIQVAYNSNELLRN